MKKDAAQQRRILGFVVGIVVLACLIGVGVYYYYHRPSTNTATKPTDYYPKASPGQTPSDTPSPSNTGPTPTIAPTSVPKTSTDKKIVITSPTQGSSVTDGTTISGTANIPTNVLYYRLKGGKSGQLADGQISITPNQTSQYSFKLGFTNQISAGGDQGELEVYALDSKGVVSSVASVAVNIQE